MLSFSKFDFNGLDLFILLMHISVPYQVHIIYTYISYCFDFVFEVSDLCLALALTILPLQTSNTSGLTLFGTHKLEL